MTTRAAIVALALRGEKVSDFVAKQLSAAHAFGDSKAVMRAVPGPSACSAQSVCLRVM